MVAGKGNAVWCEVGKHDMTFMVGAYYEYACDICKSKTVEGKRWHCAEHDCDICPDCGEELIKAQTKPIEIIPAANVGTSTVTCVLGDEGEHPMKFMVGEYDKYSCDRCGDRLQEGSRWHCPKHQADVCPPCGTKLPVFKVGRKQKLDGIWGTRVAKVALFLAIVVPFYDLLEKQQLIRLPTAPPTLPTTIGDTAAGTASDLRGAATNLRSKFKKPEPAPKEADPAEHHEKHQADVEVRATQLHNEAVAELKRRYLEEMEREKRWFNRLKGTFR